MNYKIKKTIKKFVPSFLLKPMLNVTRWFSALLFSETGNFAHLNEQHSTWLAVSRQKFNAEMELTDRYSALIKENDQRKLMRSKERKVHSQNGEDGILLYIFSKIGVYNHTFIEFGAGGYSSNTENLIRNFGWGGLLLDGSESEIKRMNEHYKSLPNVSDGQVIAKQAWLTRENINDIFKKNNIQGKIDLLSIDIDGNDYWIWEAINIVEPNVVVIEYNASLGSVEPLVIEYNNSFYRFNFHELGWYHGASLAAMTKLAKRKGYELICCDSSGANAFFIKESLLLNSCFDYLPPQKAFYYDSRRGGKATGKQQFEEIKDFKFIKV